MRAIKVSVSELEDILTKNKVTHIEEHKEALDGYWEAIFLDFEALLVKVKAKTLTKEDLNRLHLHSKPQSHEGDYDRALEMLQMHQDDTVPLSIEEFDKYVKDDWSWKEHFRNVAGTYSNKLLQ